MNQRIEKLAEQAVLQANEVFDQKGKDYMGIVMEKFAELIVQECMWKIMQRKEEAIDNDWHVDEAMSAALSDISEHFGVKE
jgi:hypothetical protein